MKKEQLLASMVYAGIGARKQVPLHIRERIEVIAKRLTRNQWTLRSGAAVGCDTFFENGCDLAHGQKQIFVPFDGYSGRWTPNVHVPHKDYIKESQELAKKFDVYNWDGRTKMQKSLLTRNVNIILGERLSTPVKFVVCWTLNGAEDGGTGHAIRIAHAHNIPVINMGEPFMRHPNAVETEIVRQTREIEKTLERASQTEATQRLERERIAMLEGVK